MACFAVRYLPSCAALSLPSKYPPWKPLSIPPWCNSCGQCRPCGSRRRPTWQLVDLDGVLPAAGLAELLQSGYGRLHANYENMQSTCEVVLARDSEIWWGLPSFASRWRVISVGKNVQSVQTRLTHSKLEITQTLLIQGITSRTILVKPQFRDSKSAVARRVGSSPTPAPSDSMTKGHPRGWPFVFPGGAKRCTLRPSDPQTLRPTGCQAISLSDCHPLSRYSVRCATARLRDRTDRTPSCATAG